jgi:hypothetical protein
MVICYDFQGYKHHIVMQEHRQHQASVGASATHFEHMLNCLKTFEECVSSQNEPVTMVAFCG